MLWPFRRDLSFTLKLATAVRWCLAFRRDYVPRQVPMGEVDVKLVVTLSDDKGGKARVSTCMCRRGCKPKAAFTQVHRSVRTLWQPKPFEQEVERYLPD